MRALFVFLFFLFCLPSVPAFPQTSSTAASEAILTRARAATVVILAGEGAGRLHLVGTGILIRPDGTILTALHVVKGAAEVQVRLGNGEVFDQVDMLGFDERRDVAALKIPAAGLPHLSPAAQSEQTVGETVYAITNANGLNWSATRGMLSATRPAADIPGAGEGFRLLQFTAPIGPGSSGSALLNASGEVIGVITGGAANAGFAVPIANAVGLADSAQRTRFGSGAALQLPAKRIADTPQSSAQLDGVNPKGLLQRAKTLYLVSKTSF